MSTATQALDNITDAHPPTARSVLHRSTCPQCGQPFEWRWPATGQRYCSPRCKRGAARRRSLSRRPTGDPVEVGQECLAALAQFRAISARAQRMEDGL